MKVQPISYDQPNFTNNRDTRVSTPKELNKPAKLSDLYKESDMILAKLEEQNKLIMNALATQSNCVVKPTEDNYNKMRFALVNLGTSGTADKLFK